MVGGARHGVGHVDEEEAEREQSGDADVDLLRRDAVEDGQKDGGREDARQDDVHHVELVPATKHHRERHVREQLVRTALEVELATLNALGDDLPLAVRLKTARTFHSTSSADPSNYRQRPEASIPMGQGGHFPPPPQYFRSDVV